jgi:hypothetical protein
MMARPYRAARLVWPADTLGTQDAHGLYAQYGFASFSNPDRQMELLRPEAPQPPGNAELLGCDKIARRNGGRCK